MKGVWVVPVIFSILFIGSLGLTQEAFADTFVTSCGSLNVPGETYLLGNDITTSGTCLTIDADDITLDGNGFILTGSFTGIDSGVNLVGRTGVTVQNMDITNFANPIRIVLSEGNTITGNTLRDSHHGVEAPFGADFNTFSDNTIFGNSAGMFMLRSSGNTITGNDVSSNDVGITLRPPIGLIGSTNNIVTNNIANFNQFHGIEVGSGSNTVSGNIVNSNGQNGIKGFSSDNTYTDNTTDMNGFNGMLIVGSNNLIQNNIMSSSFFGLTLVGSNDGVVIGNTFDSNSRFGLVLANDINTQIINNNFLNNAIQVDVPASNINPIFDLPAPVGGNYWDNFDESVEGCDDANNDGFCDSPFIFTGGQDNLPWTIPDGWVVPTIDDMINQINELDIPDSVKTSLSGPLNQAQTLLDDGKPQNDVSVCGKLTAFLNEVDAKEGNGQLTSDQADELRAIGQAVIEDLGC